MRLNRILKTAVVSVAVGSSLLLAGCGAASPPPAAGGSSSSDASSGSGGKVVAADANKLTVKPGSTGVTFTEFTDFQCPSCKQVHGAVESLAKHYEGKIDLAVRDFPLTKHQNAKIAAYAVEAAVLQSPANLEKFSGKLFDDQSNWENLSDADAKKYFVTVAESLGLDKAKFVADSDSQKVKDRVANDLADAKALNLQGTPSMFIGSTPIDLSKITSDEDMYKLVDAAIAAVGPSAASTSGTHSSSASPSPSASK